MAEIELSREDGDGRRGRYVARIDGVEGEAEITFTKRGSNLISADHTGAPETMRGTGAAAALVSFMVEDARKNGFRIMPICPYVRAQYRKHPDWQDVMTVKPGEEPAGA
ncbi:MAG: GNAT family N-acetyltransferase [Mesorhizobium sp.]